MPDLQALVEQFDRDGFLVIPDAITRERAETLRRGVERAFAQSNAEAEMYHMNDIWRPKMFEQGQEFEQLIDNPIIADFVEAVLGGNCHVIAMSALRNGPGKGISGWHADEDVRFPRPADVPIDPRIPMPCFIVNVNYYLCDVDADLGPTEFVPGSHRSGRQPRNPEDYEAPDRPIYEGRGVVSATGKAGTAVLWNDQTWHRGAINRSADKYRWVQQVPYARRYISQRFYPFVNYQMPENILERATPRRKRMLGRHALGAYG